MEDEIQILNIEKSFSIKYGHFYDDLRARNTYMEYVIKSKMNELCNIYGQLHYKNVEHSIYDNYTDLDIITQKLIVEKIKNKVIITIGMFNITSEIITNKINIDDRLRVRNFKSAGGKKYYNILLNSNAYWITLYTKDGIEIDIEKDIKLKFLLSKYFDFRVINYAVLNNYNIPIFDFNNLDNFNNTYNKVIKYFTKEELSYMGYELN